MTRRHFILVHGVRVPVRTKPPPPGTVGEDLTAVVDVTLRQHGIHPESPENHPTPRGRRS